MSEASRAGHEDSEKQGQSRRVLEGVEVGVPPALGPRWSPPLDFGGWGSGLPSVFPTVAVPGCRGARVPFVWGALLPPLPPVRRASQPVTLLLPIAAAAAKSLQSCLTLCAVATAEFSKFAGILSVALSHIFFQDLK